MQPDTLSKTSKTSTLRTYPCPRCQKATQWKDNPYKPFCSKHCKLIDLGAWANEEYSVPTQEDSFIP